MSARSQYQGIADALRRYWSVYGGWRELFSSPYTHVSLLISASCFREWMNSEWWVLVTSVLPNVLGFTLGGFAVFLGFGDEKFKELIAGKDEDGSDERSPYIGLANTFLHFLVVQILALMLAVVANANHLLPNGGLAWLVTSINVYRFVVNGFGYWLFIYSLCTALAAAIHLYRVSCMYDEYITHRRKTNIENNDSDLPSE